MMLIKPLLIAFLTLASLFVASAMNCRTVSNLSSSIDQQISLSQTAAEQGHWDEARTALNRASAAWHAHDTYLHVTVNHQDVDNAESLFAQMQQYAMQEDLDQYRITAAQLSLQLKQLARTQQLSIQNIF